MPYPHISPGDKFRPSAAKENAISRLLERFEATAINPHGYSMEERSVTLVLNQSNEEPLPAGTPVEIVFETSAQSEDPPLSISTPAALAKKITATPEYWGIALEEIPPGGLGPVQLNGVSICTNITGTPAAFVNVTASGTFIYSGSGCARVLRHNPEERIALVYLDQNTLYRGPFAVRFDGQKLSVIDGTDPASGIAGYYFINGKFLTAQKTTGITPSAGLLCITASSTASSPQDAKFEIVTDVVFPETSGAKATYPLASIKQSGQSWGFTQLNRWNIPELWTFEDCDSEEGDE